MAAPVQQGMHARQIGRSSDEDVMQAASSVVPIAVMALEDDSIKVSIINMAGEPTHETWLSMDATLMQLRDVILRVFDGTWPLGVTFIADGGAHVGTTALLKDYERLTVAGMTEELDERSAKQFKVTGAEAVAKEWTCTLDQTAEKMAALETLALKSVGGKVLRLHLAFRVCEICATCTGLSREVLQDVPDCLSSRGLSPTLWQNWTGRLVEINRLLYPAGCCSDALQHCVLAPCFCVSGKMDADRILAWDADLKQWQADFNAILEPLGIFMKTQSLGYKQRGGTGTSTKVLLRWLAFALTPKQIEELKNEPHVNGCTHTLHCPECPTWCHGGVDEYALCMHPSAFLTPA